MILGGVLVKVPPFIVIMDKKIRSFCSLYFIQGYTMLQIAEKYNENHYSVKSTIGLYAKEFLDENVHQSIKNVVLANRADGVKWSKIQNTLRLPKHTLAYIVKLYGSRDVIEPRKLLKVRCPECNVVYSAPVGVSCPNCKDK